MAGVSVVGDALMIRPASLMERLRVLLVLVGLAGCGVCVVSALLVRGEFVID
jgi:hypothetical protein